MNTFNSTLTLLTKLLLAPLAQWPLVALLVWSAVAGILMAIVFRFTSNQPAIRRAADRCRAELGDPPSPGVAGGGGQAEAGHTGVHDADGQPADLQVADHGRYDEA